MRCLWIVPFLLLIAGCQDGPFTPGAEPLRPLYTMHTPEDEAFFWLPPIGKSPSVVGEFNPDAYPSVRICRVATTAADAPCIVGTELVFHRQATAADLLLVMSEANEQYQANWKTPSVGADAFYRVGVYRTVTPESPTLGAPIILVLRADGSIDTADGEKVRQGGSNLPVKFRIDKLCTDCVETWIGEEEATLTLPGAAEIYLPEDPDRLEFRLVIQQYQGTEPCLPIPHPQYQGCYEILHVDIDGNPVNQTFEEPLTFFPCLDPQFWYLESELTVWKWDENDPTGVNSLQRLEPVDGVSAQNLDCSTFMKTSWQPTNPLTRALGSLATFLRPVGRVLGPELAYASEALQGYGVNDLSRIGWVHELAMEIVEGADQVAPAGTLLPVPLKVRVTSVVSGLPVAGVPVRFTYGAIVVLAEHGGTFQETDSDGFAQVRWHAPPTSGEVRTLDVCAFNGPPQQAWMAMTCTSADHPLFKVRWSPFAGYGNPAVLAGDAAGAAGLFRPGLNFTATAATYRVTYLSPLGTVNSAPNVDVSGWHPHVVVRCTTVSAACSTANAILFQAAAPLTDGYYQVNWQSPSNLPGESFYRVQVLWGLNGPPVGDAQLIRGVTSGSKTNEPFTFQIGRTVPIKFALQ
jgi:hypothetical protein